MRRGEAKEACDSAALALLIQSQRAFLILPPLDSMRCERVSSSATVRLYIYAHARFICEELELGVKGNWKLQEEKQRGKWVSEWAVCGQVARRVDGHACKCNLSQLASQARGTSRRLDHSLSRIHLYLSLSLFLFWL